MKSDAYNSYLETHGIAPDEILSGTTEVNVTIDPVEVPAPKREKKTKSKSRRRTGR